MKCKDVITSLKDIIDESSKDNIIRPVNSTFVTQNYEPLKIRTADCELGAIGKPVFYHALESEKFGAFLRDPMKDNNNNTVEKVWLARESEKKHLYEYRNKLEYQTKTKGAITKGVEKYELPCAFEVIDIHSCIKV